MAYLFFIDESGQDRHESPYEVLAAVAVEDTRVWSLITAIQAAEQDHFGQRITRGSLELKAKKLLKVKTFRLAAQESPIPHLDRRLLAQECLGRGSNVTRRQLTALGQAKLAFVENVLTLCAHHRVRAFASILADGPRPSGDFLRKDYSYLFERFFYFLEAQHPYQHQGIVIFDELEKSQSHLLTDQMCRYFLETSTGQMRASRIIPEPMFVHSDLTSLVQVADIIAYVISWGVRPTPFMHKPARPELARLGRAVMALRHFSFQRRRGGEKAKVSSFKYIHDLRSSRERRSAPPSRHNR